MPLSVGVTCFIAYCCKKKMLKTVELRWLRYSKSAVGPNVASAYFPHYFQSWISTLSAKKVNHSQGKVPQTKVTSDQTIFERTLEHRALELHGGKVVQRIKVLTMVWILSDERLRWSAIVWSEGYLTARWSNHGRLECTIVLSQNVSNARLCHKRRIVWS